MMVKLGQKVREVVTGFTGIVTGRVEYLTGCAQVLVQPKAKEGGEYVESRWWDETRVEILDETPVSLPAVAAATKDNGPDRPAPRR